MKPTAKVIGENGNVFNLAGIVIHALKRAECDEERKDECPLRFKCLTDRHIKCLLMDDFTEKLKGTQSYQEALTLMQEYVEFE